MLSTMTGKSIAQQFAQADAIIQNILRNKEMQQHFAAYGFPLKRIKEGQTRLKVAREMQAMTEEQRDTQYDTNQQWKADLQQAKRSYKEYVTLVRMVYQNNPTVMRKLRIDNRTPQRIQDWMDQARFFYTKVPAFNTPLEQRFGLKPEVWSQALMEIHALISVKHDRLQHKANAQRATEQRDQELKKLSEWVRELKYVARVALKEDPQLQEALGMVAK
ncbi:MAG: hypothetical protein RIG62_09130 [Cyclobacteriaceae bacterium]